MMDRMAVDVVLLPDEAMTAKTLEVNRDLVQTHGSEIVLDRETCLPHISLAMGCIEKANVASAGQVLESIGREYPTGELIISGIVSPRNAMGQYVSSFVVVNTGALQELHERALEAMEPYFSSEATAEMIYTDGPVAETTLAWIRTFRERSSFASYIPHITIGYGVVTRSMAFPMRLAVSKLALCHLGNHCTCRRVLASTDL